MGRFDPILTNFSSGEFSKLLMGRVDIAKYANGVDTQENFLNLLQGGIARRPGQRYVASTKDNGIARIIPFQYSADLDYVMEMGDEYFRLYSNAADIIEQTVHLTKLLLPSDSDNDAQYEFIDDGNTGHTVTAVATAQTSSAQKKFGSMSLLLDGDSDYLNTLDSVDWYFGTGNFTIDFWVRFDNLTNRQRLVGQRVDGSNIWYVEKASAANDNKLQMAFTTGGVPKGVYTLTNPWAVATDTWYHIEFARNGATALLFINGVSQAVTENTAFASNDVANLAAPLTIGQQNSTDWVDGHMDEIRISKGIARHTANFDVPTAAYTSDANTQLLLHCETQDISNSKHRIQFVGTAQTDIGTKKFGTASLLLDGDSDYLQILDNVNWDVVGNILEDWTIDLWVKHADHVGTETYVIQWEDANNYWLLQHIHGSGLKFIVVSNGITIIDTGFGGEITDNTTFHHIAICKKRTKYGLYKDGTQIAYVDDSSIDTFAGDLYIGATGAPGDYFQGSIDDVRVIKSNAFTADPNVGLTDTIIIPTSTHTAAASSQTEIATPYLEADIFEIMNAHKGDLKYLTHNDYAPRILSRTGASAFSLPLVPFVRGPFLDDDTSGTTITPGADTGTGITLTANADIFESTHEGALWRVKNGVVKITAYTSATVVTGDVQAEPDGTAGNLGTGPGASSDWAEGAFSDFRGWPAVCVFHNGRLYYASTIFEPQKAWGSVVFEYNNFDKDNASADDAVTFELATEVRIAVRWMASGNKALTIGSTGGIYSAYGSGNGPIIPGDIEVNRDTDYGSALLASKRIGAISYYVQRNLRKVRELNFFLDTDTLDADDMNLLAEHILREGDGIVDWDYQQTPNDRLWCVRSDGQLAVMTRNVKQESLGWGRMISGADGVQNGKYESVCVIPKNGEDDQVWVVVNRTIGSVTKRFIEYFTPEQFDDIWDAICLDSSLTLDVPITITGATKANPVVVTAVGHGLSNGDQIKIDNVVGMTELNGNSYLIADKTDDTFELQTLASVDVNGSAYTTYISGGEVRKMVTAISGLGHLEGETIQVQVDGGVPTTNSFVVSGGAITLASKAAVVHAGLPYVPYMKTLRPEGGSRVGTAQGKTKRIASVVARFYKTLACQIGTEDKQDRFTFDELFTGDKPLPIPMGWEVDGRIVCTSDKPLPLTIISLMPKLSTSDI